MLSPVSRSAFLCGGGVRAVPADPMMSTLPSDSAVPMPLDRTGCLQAVSEMAVAAAWQLLPRWVLAAVLQRSTPVLPSLKMSFALLPEPVCNVSPRTCWDLSRAGPEMSMAGVRLVTDHVKS